MSSRALRRAQKELEERKQLEQLEQDACDDESDEEEAAPTSQPKPSLFALLGGADENEEEDDDDDRGDDTGNGHAHVDSKGDASDDQVKLAPAAKPSKKSKKKKKKAKGKTKPPQEPEETVSGLDEIDQALLALNLSSNHRGGDDADQLTSTISEEMQQLYTVLSVDTQNLHAANEMRKLFGRAAVQGNEDEPARQRQRGRGQQQGLAAAVAGRNAPGGRNLASLGLRRNIFIQGKEEWPRATTGGLGMEVVEKRSDGSVEYKFVHSRTYQSIQHQFERCVASMDPERMVQLLHFNPYHISTLLQVSEIAKQQRDNATAGELLERALFSFGRAVHSTFAHNLAQGKARLDFRRPENREFWLAGWRYISMLGVRATWRTAFEWAKLLLSMAPEEDPYCLRLLIDQLALRGREPQALIDLVECDHLQREWKIPPSLAFSVALAHDRLKHPVEARKSLRLAIKEYPWVAARMCKELDISPIPKSVWGKEPNGDHQELLCQLYVPRAKDLWNTPEATSLLMELCYSIEEDVGAGEQPYWLADINEMDLARHVILSDDRALLSLIDTRVKAKYTSTSDPLAPEDSIYSYDTTALGSEGTQSRNQLLAELEQLRRYFSTIDLGRHVNGGDFDPDDLLRALDRAGTHMNEFRRNTERVQILRLRLQDLGVQVIFDEEGPNQGGPDSDADSDA